MHSVISCLDEQELFTTKQNLFDIRLQQVFFLVGWVAVFDAVLDRASDIATVFTPSDTGEHELCFWFHVRIRAGVAFIRHIELLSPRLI